MNRARRLCGRLLLGCQANALLAAHTDFDARDSHAPVWVEFPQI